MKLKVDYMTRLLLFFVALGLSSFVTAQTISGTVTDASTGEPLIGANILVVGTSTGTITDFDGKYSLNLSADAKQLEFSYTGYASTIIDIGGQTVIDVQLSAGEVLDEVVVVGYGTQKSKEVTSAVTSVNAEDFNKGNVNDPAQLLQGKVAGLSIARPGGNPNGEFSLRLRGLSTIGANTQPLIIIDGVPGAALNSVDPNDIESINVLKDGSAAAIYGTRGASGVIIITTKQGREGTAQVDYNGYVTLEQVARTVDVLDADGYRNFAGGPDGSLVGNDRGASTDWFDELTEDAITHAHTLSLSGGSKATSYRVSLNYRDIDGVALGTGFEQLNGRINLTQKAFNDRLKITMNLASTSRQASRGFNAAFRYATIYNPTAPIRDEDNPDFDIYDGYYQNVLFDYFNPVAILEQNTNIQEQRRIVANIRGSVTLAEGLTTDLFYAEQRENDLAGQFIDKNSFWFGRDRNGLAARSTEERFNRLFEWTGNYDKQLGSVGLKALVGYSFQEFENEGFAAVGGNFTIDDFSFDNLGSALDFQNGLGSVGSFRNSERLIAFFGRVNLDYDDTYYFSASLRREGSSRFGTDNQWGIFPGISAGVTLSNLFDISGVDNLKLRAGYGVTGNRPGQSYLSLLRLAPTSSFFFNGQYINSFSPVSNPNPDLAWEQKSDISVGLDFNLLDYKLNGSLDFYQTTTSDLILPFNVPVPPNLFSTTFVNIGELRSSGIELSLDYAAIDNENFSWTPNIAFSYFLENELVSLSNDNFDFGGVRDIANLGAPGQNGTPLIRVEEGAPIGQIWGLEYEGISEDGSWIFADTDGSGDIDDQADRTVIGSGLPDFTLGFNNTFTFGKFDFNFFLRGVFGHDLVNTFRAFYEAPSTIDSYNILASSGEGDLVRLSDTPKFSSLHVEDASFVRLDNATLGYTFDLPEGSSFRNIRVYLNGQNLFTITNYSGVDPEVRYSDLGPDNDGDFSILDPDAIEGNTGDPLAPGIDRRNTYFFSRAFTFGVNLGF
jgi:TonB-linked SusC/RagA family outer membrane protein